MQLNDITAAVDRGDTVHWQSTYYRVIKGPSHPDNPGNGCNPALRYLISCDNGSAIGLTWRDGVTLNGREDDFFLADTTIA